MAKVAGEMLKSPQKSPERAMLKLKRFKCRNRREIIDSMQRKEASQQRVLKPDKQRKLKVARRNVLRNGSSVESSILLDDDDDSSFMDDSQSIIVPSDDIISIPSSPPMTPQSKRVAFSSDIENQSFLTSSPLKSSPQKPRRSILKQSNVEVDNALSVDELLKGGQLENWPNGYVLHVPEAYFNKAKVVRACVAFLKDPQCNKKYELFATLNHLIKSSTNNIHVSFSLDSVYNLLKSIEIDLIELKVDICAESVSPFRLRVSSQGIKLLSLLQKQVSNNDTVKSCYGLVLDLMKSPNISKSLAASIIQLWKSQELRDLIPVEHLIANVIQMKYFLSATVICERISILSRIITARPAIASKYGYQILSYLLMTIMNTDVPSYSKILTFCISTIAQFGRHSECPMLMVKILEEPIRGNLSTMKSHVTDSLTEESSISEALIQTLMYASHINLTRQVVDCWYQILYLCSHDQKQFSISRWKFGGQWIGLYGSLLENASMEIAQLCLDKWNVVVYDFQTADVTGDDSLKLDMMLHTMLVPFSKVKDETLCRGFYHKLVYGVQWQLTKWKHGEEATRELLKTMLWPILNSPDVCELYGEITRIFGIDSPNALPTKFEDVDVMLTLTDAVMWKQVVSPLGEDAYVMGFDLLCDTIHEGFRMGPFDKWCELLSNCVHLPVHHLRLQNRQDIGKLVGRTHELIVSILREPRLQLADASKDKAKDIFRLIQDADLDVVFDANNTSLLLKMGNEMGVCHNIEFIQEFVALCLSKFNSDSVFGAMITSDIFKNLKLVRKACAQRSFPPFLNYWVNLDKLRKNGNMDVCVADPSLVSIRFKYFFSSYLKESSSGDEFLRRVGNEMGAVMDYKGFEYFDEGIYAFVFDMILHGFVEFARQDRFYKVVRLDFFKTVLSKMVLSWARYMKLVVSLPDAGQMTSEWLKFMLEDTMERLERGCEFSDEFAKVVGVIRQGAERRDRERFDKRCKKMRVGGAIGILGIAGITTGTATVNPAATPTKSISAIDTQLVESLSPNRRHTRSMGGSFERETVLNLRKRAPSFEPIESTHRETKRQRIMARIGAHLGALEDQSSEGEPSGSMGDHALGVVSLSSPGADPFLAALRQQLHALGSTPLDTLPEDQRGALMDSLLHLVVRLSD